MKKSIFIITTLILSLNVFAQDAEISQAQPYRVYQGKLVHKGIEIKYDAGKIKMKTSAEGGWISYGASKIDKIDSPMPREVRYIIDRVNMGKFADVVNVMNTAKGKTLMEQQYFCGWGKRLSAYYAYALIKEKKTGDVAKMLRTATGMVAGTDDQLDVQLVKVIEAAAASASSKAGAAKGKLKELVQKMVIEVKPYYYNIEGDLLVAEGKKQEALLSYYKTFLLDRTNPWQRGYAKAKIAEVYKSTNDPRASLINKLR